ncbi:unnamed protein product [Trifolium pratense]|uniref:Uncharacterized protein n=1 Tax=Trifolium pratense TaxID=57577 RepID=A0ACB0LTX4_TRIPR|nr:unnamed protein product [Trifolium pratense]
MEKGRDGRIRRSEDLGREEFLRRQAEEQQQEEELVPEVQPVVQPVVWPGGPIDTSLLTRGDFYTPSSFTEEEAAALATELLGVSLQCAARETRKQRGGYFSQQWLFDNYIRQCEVENYDCAARSYLLLLIGCTICTNKSFTRVDAKYLPMFRVLPTCSRFAWGAIALVELYDTLNDASIFTTKGLAGYATLLQCWIHEYFPTLGRRAESGIDCDIPGASLPRARRWRYRQGNVKLPAYRPVLDALTPDDVIWRPFQDHRAAFPFDLVSMYSGYLRGCTVVRYLPERCIRQFGYVQYIPPPPPAPAIDVIDSDWIGYDIAVDRIVQPTRQFFRHL